MLVRGKIQVKYNFRSFILPAVFLKKIDRFISKTGHAFKSSIRFGLTYNVDGYTISQIFGALRPGVETVQGFRNRLLQNNGNHQQQAVNNLFEAYYYN